MANQQTFVLSEERIRRLVLDAVRRAPLGKEIVIQDEKRTTEQNRRWWDQLQAIADSGTKFDGQEWDQQGWHDIILHAFLTMKGRETGSAHKGLNGGVVIVGRFSSTKLSKKDFSEMMEMTTAFIAEHDIVWEEAPIPVPSSYR